MPTLTLPTALQSAITAALREVPRSQWLNAAQRVSERYRGTRSDSGDKALVSGSVDALGYAAIILPATYAQLYGAMAATAARIPSWQPATMLDLGSGPGTALWAALECWPGLSTLEAWEREPALMSLGQQLAASGPAPLQATHWRQQDLRTMPERMLPGFDLVVLGHVLNELDSESQIRTIARAWAYTRGVLLIVEPGTSSAFPIVRAARNNLLECGASTIAPCPHDLPCPLIDDWCHFPQRLQRPAFQKDARAAPSAWEDAKFAYAAMARFTAELPITGRVIRDPVFNKAYAEALLCQEEGVAPLRVLKRDREAFRQVKELRWGEVLVWSKKHND